MRDDDRGSGRTHSQIAMMRDGDIFIVGNHAEIQHSRSIAERVGVKVRILPKSISPDQIRGLSLETKVVVDHACDIQDPRMRECIFLHNSKVKR